MYKVKKLLSTDRINEVNECKRAYIQSGAGVYILSEKED